MRSITRIANHDEALLAGAHLVSNGVECKVSEESNGESCLWVMNEDHLPQARELLAQFMADPNKEKYREAVEFARRLARQQEEQIEAADKQAQEYNEDARRLRNMMTAPAPLTIGLILLLIGIWLLPSFNKDLSDVFLNWLSFTTPGSTLTQTLLSGEIWRLASPVLLNPPLLDERGGISFIGVIGLIFNVLWLRDLGGLIERREGTWRFLALFALFAALPNLMQYGTWGIIPACFSGVVYGMLAYLWMRGKHDPRYGIKLNPGLLWFMLIWMGFILMASQFTMLLPVGGLLAGAGAGYGLAMLRKYRMARS